MNGLELTDIGLSRGGRRVLHGVSACCRPGRLTAVIGPNGAGKSSLLEVAAGLRAPDAGAVRFGGRALAAMGRRDLARLRAYLPQRAGVDWPISVERLVALGLTPELPAFGDLPAALRPAVAAALESCDLTHLAGRAATALSGGELARAMLARAMVGQPRLLIVDEPTAGLDPRHAADAVMRLRGLAAGGCAVVMACHELDLVLNGADDVLALREGQVLAQGPVMDTMRPAMLEALFDMPVAVLCDADGMSIRLGHRLR